MERGKNEGSAESEVEWGDGWCEDFPRKHRASMVTRCQIHVSLTRGPHTTTIVRGRGFQQIEVGRSGNTAYFHKRPEALLRTSSRTCARAQSERGIPTGRHMESHEKRSTLNGVRGPGVNKVCEHTCGCSFASACTSTHLNSETNLVTYAGSRRQTTFYSLPPLLPLIAVARTP